MSFPLLTVYSAITLGTLQQPCKVYCQFTDQETEAQRKEM